MELEVLTSLAEVSPAEWNALAGDDDPFVEHGFLSAFEESGAVSPRTGWTPVHLVVREGGEPVGALPLYAKMHSYGEFIFDWAWAGAAEQLRTPYYPKLVSMVPFSPVTGRRVLVRQGADVARVTQRLVDGLFEVADAVKASSIHVLFTTEAERDALIADGRLLPRLSFQFHWHNRGYGTFDDFLGAFRAPVRKQTRRERESVRASGLDIRVKVGAELDDADWAALKDFYAMTCDKKGSPEYLPPPFFDALRRNVGDRVVGVLAYRDGAPVAGTMNFEKGAHLYGRYWGSYEEVDSLHFELCYYQLIERAIAKGATRFEAGAQGMHKLRRGLMPSETHSVHWVRHPVLARAVKEHVAREADMVRSEMEALAPHGPFRRAEPGEDKP